MQKLGQFGAVALLFVMLIACATGGTSTNTSPTTPAHRSHQSGSRAVFDSKNRVVCAPNLTANPCYNPVNSPARSKVGEFGIAIFTGKWEEAYRLLASTYRSEVTSVDGLQGLVDKICKFEGSSINNLDPQGIQDWIVVYWNQDSRWTIRLPMKGDEETVSLDVSYSPTEGIVQIFENTQDLGWDDPRPPATARPQKRVSKWIPALILLKS